MYSKQWQVLALSVLSTQHTYIFEAQRQAKMARVQADHINRGRKKLEVMQILLKRLKNQTASMINWKSES